MWFIGSPMAKKKSWFDIMKRFFIRETNSKPAKVKWLAFLFNFGLWFSFGGLKIKRLASLTAADEVAVTTAQVAAEVVEFTGNPQSDYQCEHEVKEFSDIRVQGEATQSNHQCEREILEFAATRIQSAFQGYLVSLNKHSLSRAEPEIFGWGGRGNIIILICNSRKIQSMTYIHIYISSCISCRKKNIKSNQN